MLKKLVVFALSSGLAAKIYRAYAAKVRAGAVRPATGARIKPSWRDRF